MVNSKKNDVLEELYNEKLSNADYVSKMALELKAICRSKLGSKKKKLLIKEIYEYIRLRDESD